MTFREVGFDADKGYAVFSVGKCEYIVHRETYERDGVPFRPCGSEQFEFEPGSKLATDSSRDVELFIAKGIRLQSRTD